MFIPRESWLDQVNAVDAIENRKHMLEFGALSRCRLCTSSAWESSILESYQLPSRNSTAAATFWLSTLVVKAFCPFGNGSGVTYWEKLRYVLISGLKWIIFVTIKIINATQTLQEGLSGAAFHPLDDNLLITHGRGHLAFWHRRKDGFFEKTDIIKPVRPFSMLLNSRKWLYKLFSRTALKD